MEIPNVFRLSRLIPILVVAACVCTPLSAQEKQRAELFVVARKTPLISYTTDPSSEIIALDPGDLLRLTPTKGTADLCARLASIPGIEVSAGGGVRGRADLEHLRALGLDSALVASALHDGHLCREDLVELRT